MTKAAPRKAWDMNYPMTILYRKKRNNKRCYNQKKEAINGSK